MKPITEDQFVTLRHWAITIKRRPGSHAKQFLKLEKGLTEEQIDKWWDDAMVQISQGPCQLKYSPVPPRHLGTTNSYDSPNYQDSHLESQFSAYEIPENDQYPLASNYGQFNTQEVEPSQAVERVQRWSRAASSYSSYLSSPAPSVNRASSLLSVPSEDRECVDRPESRSRASYGSSLRTNTTASSSFSFTELLAEEGNEICLPKSIDPSKLTTNHYSSTEPSTKLRKERRPTSVPTPNSKQRRPHIGFLSSSAGEAPLRSDKSSGVFACTACQHPFSGKGEWKRHEGSQCEPQKLWICMLGDAAISTENGWVCAFCDEQRPGPDRAGIDTHLEEEHKVSYCSSKSVEARTFRRKDKLKPHLQRVHALSENSEHWLAWNQNTATQVKSAWGCGFCGVFLFTWEGRLEHIGEHFEKEHLDISHWSHSLMIKGLLRQPTDNFNILQEWKDLVKSEGDSHLGWLREDAEDLKRKLEFREGTPWGLAAEAFKLAMNLDLDRIPSLTDSVWGSRNAIGTSLARSSTPSDLSLAIDKAWPQKPVATSQCLSGVAEAMQNQSPWYPHLFSDMSRNSGGTTMIGSLPDVEMRGMI